MKKFLKSQSPVMLVAELGLILVVMLNFWLWGPGLLTSSAKDANEPRSAANKLTIAPSSQPLSQEVASQTVGSASNDEAYATIGREKAIPVHLQDGEEFNMPVTDLLAYGQKLFTAQWTPEDGVGRPLTNGTGKPIADSEHPLVFPRRFNRVSGLDANSCAGCHNAPFGIAGGGGDFVANVFVLGQRFDFVTLDPQDTLPKRGAVDENGKPVTLQTVANNRATTGMFGAGYIEMLARQITADLQRLRDGVQSGQEVSLSSKGIGYGILRRTPDGTWDVSQVIGLPAPSLVTTGPTDPPNLIVRPFHQASNVVSLRQFSNNAFNHHHGIQTTERFGKDSDPDGDGVSNEMTRADVTAVTLFQAAMAVPGRVIPSNPIIVDAIWKGEKKFEQIGCAACHMPALPLDQQGWNFSEPNPYNPTGNLQPKDAIPYTLDLNSPELPQPRLQAENGVVYVPTYSDFRLHDITSGPDDPNREPLNMNAPAGSPEFNAGNGKFLTKRLWGAANEPPYFHHGQFTTLREAVLAHSGEALISRQNFQGLNEHEQDCVIEFLKSLQVLPPGTTSLVVDEHGQPRPWPPQ